MSDVRQRDPTRWMRWAKERHAQYENRARDLNRPWYDVAFPPPLHGWDYPPASTDRKELLLGWTPAVTDPVKIDISDFLLDRGQIGFGVFPAKRLKTGATLEVYSGRAYRPTDRKDFCPDGAYGVAVHCLRSVECGLDGQAHVEDGHTLEVVSDPFRVSNANWTCLVNSPREWQAGSMVLVPDCQNCLVSTERSGFSGVPVMWAERNIQGKAELLWDYGEFYWEQESSKFPPGPSRAILESCRPSGAMPIHWLDPRFAAGFSVTCQLRPVLPVTADDIGVQKLLLQCYIEQWREVVALVQSAGERRARILAATQAQIDEHGFWRSGYGSGSG